MKKIEWVYCIEIEEIELQDAVDLKIACAQILEILLLNLLSWSSLQNAEPKSLGQQTS